MADRYGSTEVKRDRLRELRDVWREVELLQLDDVGLASVGLHDMHA
jgi:hypothetical protein